jgi:transcriptional regulator with XRE-family HTH domain
MWACHDPNEFVRRYVRSTCDDWYEREHSRCRRRRQKMTGDELRRLRQVKGWTQRVMAAHLGVAPNTVARWERGELPIPEWIDRREEAERAARRAKRQAAERRAEERSWERPRRQFNKAFATDDRLRPEAEKVYRRLAAKYHPDRNPAAAEFMADLNELWQAVQPARK